jgi:gluconolactonase
MDVIAHGFGLLEGPVWDPAKGLFVADADVGGVYHVEENGTVTCVVPHRRGIGGMVLHESGGFIVSGRNLAYKDLQGSPTRVLFDSDLENGRIGFNDITSDNAGRIYAGSLGFFPTVNGDEPKPGALYLIDLDGTVRHLFDGVQLTNGMGFSPNGKLLYHSDSGDQTVYVYDVLSDGGVRDRRPFATVDNGLPDGLAVSVDGAVWVAIAHAGEVRVYEPSGTLCEHIAFPVPMITSLCFGGPDLRRLYVVSGSDGIPGKAGTVFRLSVDVPGLPVATARVHIA